MTGSLTIKHAVHFGRADRGAPKRILAGAAPVMPEPGRVPRISRLMALAIRFEQLISDGEVTDYSELARLGHVTRARITQVMNLLLLAPDIQEQLLFLPRIECGRDRIHLRQLQPITQVPDWRKQRRLWTELVGNLAAQSPEQALLQ